jgi:hypothetical protein
MSNPGTAGTAGRAMAEEHVLAGAVREGDAGNITTLTVLLSPQDPVPAVPAGVVPQADARTYFDFMVWHPGVEGIAGEAAYALLSILY